ncbi:antibiotic biosynthesis monooxygenase [Brevibacillus parabrevis]
MVEKWADAAAVAAHNASAHFQAFIKQAAAFVSAPMEVEVFAGEPVKL